MAIARARHRRGGAAWWDFARGANWHFQAPAATPVITLQPAPALLTITGYAPLLATTICPTFSRSPATRRLLATTIRLTRRASHDHRLLAPPAGDHDTARRGDAFFNARRCWRPRARRGEPCTSGRCCLVPGSWRCALRRIYGPDGIYTGTLRNSGGVWLRRR